MTKENFEVNYKKRSKSKLDTCSKKINYKQKKLSRKKCNKDIMSKVAQSCDNSNPYSTLDCIRYYENLN